MARNIKITYDIVTEESAMIGDFAESGWENKEGVIINPDSDDIEEYDGELNAVVALVVKQIGNCVEASDYPVCAPGHTWYTEIDPSVDYSTGEEKTLSFHLYDFLPEEEIAIYEKITGIKR